MVKKIINILNSIKSDNMAKSPVRFGLFIVFSLVFGSFFGNPAFAQLVEVSDVAENMTTSVELLPGILTAIAYMIGILLGVLGVLNLKNHVENPNNTPLRKPIIMLLAGGALFALPIVYSAMSNAISGGAVGTWGGRSSLNPIQILSASGGALASWFPLLGDANQIMENIVDSIENVPGLITAVAYLFGLLFGVLGILKIKEHVESPEQVRLKDGVIRLLVGGAFFAIPTVYEALYMTITDGNLDGFTIANAGLAMTSFVVSDETTIGNSCLGRGFVPDLGGVLCSVMLHTAVAPAFMTAISYVIGLLLGLWGLFKLRDHVENPQQTKLSEGVSRLLAGGAFFAFPYLTEVARNTVFPNLLLLDAHDNTGFNDAGATGGLTQSLFNFMNSLLGPATNVMNWFGYVAGAILIMIALMRLIKSAQEGPRGPAGFGTLMTFIAGGALISFNQLLAAFSTSMFNNNFIGGGTETRAALQYVAGMSAAELAHAHIVISAILKFMIIVGFASFIRGIFIIRDVAEGKQQSSVMSGVTHMIGGALAVNLGPLLNAVQTTLGIVGFGVVFT